MQWQKLLIWLLLEVLQTCCGLDDIADYAEFVFPTPQPSILSVNEKGF